MTVGGLVRRLWPRRRGHPAAALVSTGTPLAEVLTGLFVAPRPDAVASVRAVLLLVHQARMVLEGLELAPGARLDLVGVELGLLAQDLRHLTAQTGRLHDHAVTAATSRQPGRGRLAAEPTATVTPLHPGCGGADS